MVLRSDQNCSSWACWQLNRSILCVSPGHSWNYCRSAVVSAYSSGSAKAIFPAETGLGKALLLDEDEATWERLYVAAKGGKPSRGAINAFITEMQRHKARGEVLHDSELGDGVRSIATPIRDAKGNICIAISIASAAHYLTDELRATLAQQVMRSAEQISTAVGYSGPR
ncbi:MAG: hypothetical protein OSA39_01200 [Sphingobium sp.]|nr:hypothetical protein [Sphingobium sp.]